MAREKQPESGQRQPYDARYGLTAGPCRGLDLAHDPSVIADEALTQAINVRVHDGIVLSRYGQSAPLNADDAMSGCVQGLIDINGGGPRFVLAMYRPSTLTSTPQLSDIDLFDRQLETPYVRITDAPSNNRLSAQPQRGIAQGGTSFDDASPRYAFLWWNDQIIFGGYDNDLDERNLYRFIFPDDDLDADSVQVEQVLALFVPGEMDEFAVASMCALPDTNANKSAEYDPKQGPPLYFGTVGGGVVGYVNGELVRLQDEGTFSGRVIVFQYHNRVYAAGRQLLKVQNGWADGGSPASASWSSVTLPGTVSDFLFMFAQEWLGYGYLGGVEGPGSTNEGRILRIDDSSGSPVVTEVNDGDPGGDGILCFDDMAIALGGAYVSYRKVPSATESADVRMLNVDGTLGATIGTWEENGQVPRLLGVPNALYISAWASGNDPSGSGNASVAIWQYDGSALSKLSDVVQPPPSSEVAPFDMVAF